MRSVCDLSQLEPREKKTMKLPEFEMWDGVRAEDHPEEYEDLLRAVCARSDTITYVSNFVPRTRLCRTCYGQLQGRGRLWYQLRTTYHSVVTALHAVHSACSRCDRRLITTRPASQCAECVSTFLEGVRKIPKKRYPVQEKRTNIKVFL